MLNFTHSKIKMRIINTLLFAGSNFFQAIYGYAPIVRSDSSCSNYGGQCLDDRYYDCSGSHNCPDDSCGWQSGLCDGDTEYGKTKNITFETKFVLTTTRNDHILQPHFAIEFWHSQQFTQLRTT